MGKHRGSAWAGWLLLPARCQQSEIWAVLLDVPASSAPFQQPLVAVAPCWAQLGCLFPEHSSCHLPRAKHQAGCDLFQTLPWALPSCARGDADPSACWALLCEDLLPPWGEWGRAPSSQLCAVPSRARGGCLLLHIGCSLSPGRATPASHSRWLSWREGHRCVLNCLKVIKSSWADILNRTLVTSVNL